MGAQLASSSLGTRILTFFYRRLGRNYPAAFLIAELQSAWLVTLGTLALYTFYYDAPSDKLLPLLLTALALTGATMLIAMVRGRHRLRPVQDWIAGERDAQQTADAWKAAVGLPWQIVRYDMFLPVFGVALPGSIIATLTLDLGWLSFFPIFAGALIAISYSGVLHYFAIESGMRPVLIDINSAMSPRQSTGVKSLPLRLKLLGALPLINIITGLLVAALSSNGGGGSSLGADVLIATGVAFTISFELTVLLSRSILRPIRDLERATDAVRRGDYTHQVPITTADELGELGAAFNQMVAGLAEREQMREVFGTYLDEEVAELLLNQGVSPGGEEVEVSLLFCDVLGFTEFASQAEASAVVSKLNALFEVVVPIIGRHGGHIDKFVGDGLLAVFGAPQPLDDHADRAVLASVEIAESVNGPGSALMRVGIGVNSGMVVAGSIGGAGRLNFSVIGDAVNVAARVEQATRELGDDILITADTVNRLGHTIEVSPRGPQPLKGKDEPIELFAPVLSPIDQTIPRTEHDEAGAAESFSVVESQGSGPITQMHTLPGS